MKANKSKGTGIGTFNKNIMPNRDGERIYNWNSACELLVLSKLQRFGYRTLNLNHG